MRGICRISRVENSKTATVLAPSHGLCSGARICITGVKGMSELDGRIFVVGRTEKHTFQLEEKRDVLVSRFDIKAGILTTSTPHEQWSHSSINLVSLGEKSLDAGLHLEGMSVSKIIDETSIALAGKYNFAKHENGAWDAAERGLSQFLATNGPVVMDTFILLDGVKSVDLSSSSSPGFHGQVTLAPWPLSPPEAVSEWQASTSIIGSTWRFHSWCLQNFHFVREVNEQLPQTPVQPELLEVESLVIDFCGTASLHHAFYAVKEYSSCEDAAGLEQVFAAGTNSIAFCRKLGVWCIFADVCPRAISWYELEHGRKDAGLVPHLDGLQLLYISTSSSPLGEWKAVLGKEPAPTVKALKPQLPATLQFSSGFKLNCTEVNPAIFLGILLDFSKVDWRCFEDAGKQHGPSAAEIGSNLVDIVTTAFAVRAVSRAFAAASGKQTSGWCAALRDLLQLRMPGATSCPKSQDKLTGPSETSSSPRGSGGVLHSLGVDIFNLEVLSCCEKFLDPASAAQLERASRALAAYPGPVKRRSLAWKKAIEPLWSTVSIFLRTRGSWVLPFSITEDVNFQRRTWACSLSAIRVSTTINRASSSACDPANNALENALPACIRFAHQLLHGVPLCWDREATVNGVSTISQNDAVTETTFYANLVSTHAGLKANAQLLWKGGELFSKTSGRPIREQHQAALRKFVASLPAGASLSMAQTARGFQSFSRDSGRRCTLALNFDDHDASECDICKESRSWSQLHAYSTSILHCENMPSCRRMDDPEQSERCSIIVKIKVLAFVVPFFFISTDDELLDLNFPSDLDEVSDESSEDEELAGDVNEDDV
eukprot:TRINITY_DN78637_c0_g1_i1.p1 TRINITY_DN78637_c0_g1~~TRINITY_DN78637_c0_g1_i1.p1  ORF type:complete len:843 (+),score=127.16 TRINITY_DN78637_c0_g1_i1:46-2529(+)